MVIKEKYRALILLLAFLFATTILIPHQHHVDGSPCFEAMHQHVDMEEEAAQTGHEANDCESHGHNVMYYSNDYQGHEKSIDPSFFLHPLYVLYPLALLELAESEAVPREYPNYSESTYHIHLVYGLGLRAPPCL